MTISDDRVVERYQELMDAVRPYGMRVFQQLFHAGQHRARRSRRRVPWACLDACRQLTGARRRAR